MTGPTPATREAVYERDNRRCVRCGASGPLTLQHRTARGMGGTRRAEINFPPNLVTLCGSGTTGCHGWTEAHPTLALDLGYRVARGEDPVDRPVLYARESSWYLLNDDGTRTWYEIADSALVVRHVR